ncbi:cupredoxin domain-containing protein [Euzebya sp.]|uniref:cupredoxin domain-containing protein n=1 Tax=Euzebya sp. TaxID=1971409 RepID=UPI003512E517
MAVLLASACTPGPVPVDAVQAADTIDVGLTDFAIATSAERLVDGVVTVQVTNAGATAHDLRVAGGDVQRATSVLPPGASTVIRLNASGEETLNLWCTLPGHRRQGMEATLRVGS